jgi:plastocyanin
VAVVACVAQFGELGRAAQIHGEVVIQRKLTRRTVTASAGAYSRGPAVGLSADLDEDPLAFERRHVVIYVEGNGSGSKIEAKIEQQNRRFLPDLVVVSAGSSVTFPNEDVIFHNIFSLSKAKSFDLGNYSKGQTRTVIFPHPGIVYVNCHLHPNMSATIFVTPNGWATTADPTGHFSLDLPPGRYTVVAWHKAAGFFKKVIDVRGESASNVVFLIAVADDGIGQSATNR